jgi:hypothetical protein
LEGENILKQHKRKRNKTLSSVSKSKMLSKKKQENKEGGGDVIASQWS